MAMALCTAQAMATGATVVMTSPSNGAVFNEHATVTLSASVSPNGLNIGSTTFYSNNAVAGPVASGTTPSITLPDLAPGTYNFYASTNWYGAYGCNGNCGTSTSSPVTITVLRVNVAPTASISAPVNGKTYSVSPGVNASVQVSATGSDSDGTITKLQLIVDGSIDSTFAGSSLNTTLSLPAGTHNLSVIAIDNEGGTRTSTTVSVTVVADASGGSSAPVYSQSRTSSFTYDPETGLLKSETIEPDNPDYCVNTTYTYDAYGNKTSATTANCAGAAGNAIFASRTSNSIYDTQTVNVTVAGSAVGVVIPKGTFPTTVKNALNQGEDKTFDPRFGTVTRLIGPNGADLATNWQVDDFGRVVKELRADGTSTVTAYCLLAGRGLDTSSNSSNCPVPAAEEAPADAVSFTHTEPHNTSDTKNGPFARVYLDRAGHKIRTVTEAFDGTTQPGGTSRLIVQDTDYSDLGAAVITTQPYFLDTKSSVASGTAGYGMSKTVYDALGRPVEIYVSDPEGSRAGIGFGSRGTRKAAVTIIAYNTLTTKTTNDLGQTRTEEKNIDGKVVRVTDAYGAQVAHQYDPFGNLVATKDALQNIVRIDYDLRGRKIALTDPDTGKWQYAYDALGELVWQQSANQAAAHTATTMIYDVLGRMKQRTEPEYISYWAYDTCATGKGKLCATSTSHGVTRTMVYDSLGRLVNTRTDMGGTVGAGNSFATAVAYDSANGRIASQTYPTGLKVNYGYTTKGFLSALTLATAATVDPLPATAGGTSGPGATLAAGSLLWQAQAYNAWGKAEQQIYGNGVITRAAFDSLTGRVAATTAGKGSATDAMNYSYQWDSLSHLAGRTDANGDGSTGAVTDNYYYDDIGRLKSYTVSASQIPSLQRTVTFQYNALGSMLYKSDVGIYNYGTQATAGVKPHALQSVSGDATTNYFYDANGNLTSADDGSYRKIGYTSFNLPDSQAGVQGPSGSPQYTWQYDENHQRIKETRINASGSRTTWMLHPDAANGLSFESEESGGLISNRHYLSVGGQAIGVLISTGNLPALAAGQAAPPSLAGVALVKVEYWHKDHLGSLVSTTDHTGVVTARYAYDPFGKRRYATGVYDADGNLKIDWNGTNAGTDRGYAGAEHLDDVGIIHMNGRLFDPKLGMFMQGDPYIQDPLNLQNYNRYGYCYNNPMICTDPSGQLFGWDDALFVIFVIWGAEQMDVIDAKTARMWTGVVVAMGLAPCTGCAELFGGGMAQAAVAGFAGGAISTGSLKGGLQGAFTAGMFYGAGNVINGGNFFTGGGNAAAAAAWEAHPVWGIALHGVVGCVTSEASGGKCGPGALSAAFTEAMAPTTAQWTNRDPFAGTVVSAVMGGTASVLGGGKFANGARTGAFSYLFNCSSHPDTPCTKDEIQSKAKTCNTTKCINEVMDDANEAKLPNRPRMGETVSQALAVGVVGGVALAAGPVSQFVIESAKGPVIEAVFSAVSEIQGGFVNMPKSLPSVPTAASEILAAEVAEARAAAQAAFNAAKIIVKPRP